MMGTGLSFRLWRRHCGTLFVVIALAILFLVQMTGQVVAADAEIKDATQESFGTQSVSMETQQNHSFGLVPMPFDFSFLNLSKNKSANNSSNLSIVQADPLPASYDLRSEGKLTEVRDQSPIGCCWAFAAYGSLESCLLPSETWDFSENNMRNNHGFDLAQDGGGNSMMAMAYLARWSGPVLEDDDKYQNLVPGRTLTLPPVKHVQKVLLIPERADSTDNDSIKHAVIDHGAVYTTMYWNDAYYRDEVTITGHVYAYFGASEATVNHAVNIVGWDDNYSRLNFTEGLQPHADGAFIIRNSWGTDFGDNGYCYISYEDINLGTEGSEVFCNADDTENYDEIYQYDPLGCTNFYLINQATAWGANVFKANENGEVKAVGTYFWGTGTASVVIEKGGNSPSITGQVTKSFTITEPGYHTLVLDESIPYAKDQNISVAIKYDMEDTSTIIPIEKAVAGYSSLASASAGQSFYRYGDADVWTDVTSDLSSTANLCIKAYINNDITGPIEEDNTKLVTDKTSISAGAGWFAASENGDVVKVVAEGGSSTDTAVGSGTTTINNEGGMSAAITGLTADTAYDIFVIDAAGNPSTKIDIEPRLCDLDLVEINVAAGSLSGTETAMEYSLDSTYGGNGSWSSCSSGSTAVAFVVGKVYVREAANQHYYKLVSTLAEGTAPALSSDDILNTISGLDSTYEYEIGSGGWISGDIAGDFSGATTVLVRKKATASDLPSQSQNITFTTNGSPSISVAGDGSIKEGSENGEVITVTLTNAYFADPINPDNWTITGLPAGVSKGTVTRINANHVTIALSGSATIDFDTEINITVGCTATEIIGGSTTYNSTNTVVLTAIVESTGGGGGGGGGGALLVAAYDMEGQASVNPLAGGKVGLKGDAVVEFPAFALQGSAEKVVKILRVNPAPASPANLVLLSDVFEFTVGDKTTYGFNRKVTISFKFTPTSLTAGVKPQIYYYDPDKQEWIKIGGTISGSVITAEVDHFTKYTVMAVKTAAPVQPTTPSAPVQEAGSFSDMNTHWAKVMVADLVKRGIMSGYPDGTFKPQKAMSRPEFTVVLMNVYGIGSDNTYQLKYQDAKTIPSWAKGYVAAAAKAGILPTVWGNQFNSKALITRADMAYMIGKLSKVKTTVKPKLSFKDKIPAWAAPYVAYVSEKGIVSGYPDKTFRPAKVMSRAEACAVLAKLKK